MWDILIYLVFAFVLAAAGLAGYLYWTGQISASASNSGIFRPKPERRLDVVEQSNIDSRRRLVLIRRDNIEHLIMTGGPVDVLIETGIGQARTAVHKAPTPAQRAVVSNNTRSDANDNQAGEPSTPVFSRTPRTLGQASAED